MLCSNNHRAMWLSGKARVCKTRMFRFDSGRRLRLVSTARALKKRKHGHVVILESGTVHAVKKPVAVEVLNPLSCDPDKLEQLQC